MTTRYGREALRAECERVANALEGERNGTLSLAAGSIFQLVAGGAVDEGEAVRELTRAGIAAGLADWEVRQTLDSARGYGERQPRGSGAGAPAPLCFESDAAWDAIYAAWDAEWLASPDTPSKRAHAAAGRCRPCYEANVECSHRLPVEACDATWAGPVDEVVASLTGF